eukprot:554036_1
MSVKNLVDDDKILLVGFLRQFEVKHNMFVPDAIMLIILKFFQLVLYCKNCELDLKNQSLKVEKLFANTYFVSKIPWSNGKHIAEIKCLTENCQFGFGVCTNYIEDYEGDYYLENDNSGTSYFMKIHYNSAPSLCKFIDGHQKYRKYYGQNCFSTNNCCIKIVLDLDDNTITCSIGNGFGYKVTHDKHPIDKHDEYYFGFYSYRAKQFEILQCS